MDTADRSPTKPKDLNSRDTQRSHYDLPIEAVKVRSSPEGGAATRALFALEGGLLPKEVPLLKEASPTRGGSATAVRLYRRAAALATATMLNG